MPLTAGSQVGPYRVVEPIGAGGMGEVYRARDERLGREIALKVLPEAFAADHDRIARFRREAQLLASLNHPNVAAIYGVEDSGGLQALVMELVEGPTLLDRIARGPLPVEDTLSIAQQVCEGLDYAHERGIVHRDLKPANVKLSADGKVKLLDFGLAKAWSGDAAATGSAAELSQSPTLAHTGTQAGIILGTAGYMSPEQAKGRPVDRRADTWAFGCLLYEMLTGRRAFDGETVTDVLAAVLRAEPDWSKLPPDTPPAIQTLLERCLRKDARRRQQGMGDARIAIEEAVSSGPAAAASVAGAGSVRAPAWRRALPWLAGLAAGAAVTVLALRAVSPGRAQPAALHFRAVTSFAGVQSQPALSPDGRSVAFISNRDGHYNVYVGLVSGGKLLQITDGANVKARPRWSPDGTTIAYARLNDSGLWDVWQVAALGGTPRRLILNATDPAWSPDGQRLAYTDGATATIWAADPDGQNPRQLTKAEPFTYALEPRFSPDGRSLVFVARRAGPYSELKVVDLTTGAETALTRDGAFAISPAWSPDGRFVYFASSRGGTVNLWRIAASRGVPEQVTAGQGDDAQPDVSSDGRRIVFSTYRENLGIVRVDLNAKGEAPRRLTSDPARNQMSPVYSPDGKRLAYFSNLKGVEKETIWAAAADGSDPVPLVQDSRVNIFPQWSPDGEHILYQSLGSGLVTHTEVRRVSVSGGAPETLLPEAPLLTLDVGVDGRLLFRDKDGKVRSYDPSTRRTETLAVSRASDRGFRFRWSADGRSLGYAVPARREGDPDAGVWIEDFHSPPRQVFRGWVDWFARGRDGTIVVVENKADLDAVVWKVGWTSAERTRIAHVPLLYTFMGAWNYLDMSPDGRYLAVSMPDVLQANIGMIEGVPLH